MEDKTFELLTKMYNEFNEKFSGMEDRQSKLENIVTRIENKQDNDLKALFDGFKQAIELGEENKRILNHVNDKQSIFDIKTDVMKSKIENIELNVELIKRDVKELSAKVDKQEVEIKVIKGGKT